MCIYVENCNKEVFPSTVNDQKLKYYAWGYREVSVVQRGYNENYGKVVMALEASPAGSLSC